MGNKEILNRFDVLYNNIMSNLAPGLDGYEKSVFWNKATLEVLKNHLNPKGNKYIEGFDSSSKRQIEFSDLVVTDEFWISYRRESGMFTHGLPLDYVDYTQQESLNPVYIELPKDILSIINESVDVLVGNELEEFKIVADTLVAGKSESADINHDGIVNSSDVTAWVPYLHKIGFSEESQDKATNILRAIASASLDPSINLDEILISVGFNIKTIFDEHSYKTESRVVVPLTNIEYDTLMSRPYKYPPKSLVWRVLANGKPEFISDNSCQPVKYHIRYVKVPADVNLESNVNSEVPEVLHDEILQRAVELAKNSWEGNIETAKTFGERSE